MRSNSLKAAMTLGFVALFAWSIPACGGDDDDKKSSGGAGGTGATGGGGTGGGAAGTGGGAAGTGGGAAGTGGGTSITCGSETCTGWKVGGLIDVPACCAGANKDSCGAMTDATIQSLLKVPPGCYEQNQPGTVDCGCESFVFTNPLDQTKAQFNGCCRTDGKCGIIVNTTSVGGPNLGCMEGTVVGLTAATCTPGSETPPPPPATDGGSALCPVAGDGGTPDGGSDGGASDASAD